MTRKDRITHVLKNAFSPDYLSVEDESKNHHVPKDAQTHIKLILVSNQFLNLSRIKRHRMINELLSEEFSSGLHALSMHLYTAEEWNHINKQSIPSPVCRDGYQHKRDTQ